MRAAFCAPVTSDSCRNAEQKRVSAPQASLTRRYGLPLAPQHWTQSCSLDGADVLLRVNGRNEMGVRHGRMNVAERRQPPLEES